MMMNNITKMSMIFIVGLLLSLGLFMNPGYFSHDEVGWGVNAISASSVFDIEYYNIFNYAEFHYRPLNFNLWLFTSYYLFDTPQLYHLFLVCCGLINSVLVYLILKNEVDESIAFLTSLISAVMPTVLFVNGWIGTIADIFWFMCCAISFLIYQRVRLTVSSSIISLLVATIFFVFALMFKETAVVFPGVIFLYVLYINNKNNNFILVYKNKQDVKFFFISTVIVLVYLVVRFEYLFPSEGGGYATSISNIPNRMLDYFIYPFLLGNIEIHGLFEQHSSTQIIIALSLHLIFIALLCRKTLFNYFLYLSFYFVTSVPILILDTSLPHYIYASGFVMAFSVSCIFYKERVTRIISVVFLLMLAWHGVNIQKNFVFTGEYHNNFINTLHSVIKSNDGSRCNYLVQVEPGSASWIAVRAIAFRSKIDDLNIEKRVLFESSALTESNDNEICNLLLDKKGRVSMNVEVSDVY
ncbi:MAG: hypothetical protein WBH20_11505 [Oceanisphaera sp.]|uniref:hypothetical protein n=1 Tax=Oceanisphaera sp. TaxID=1929979 RepID=UPI003C747805